MEALLRGRIGDGGLTFQEFMAISLYHPELGYYARPAVATVGKKGDFVTSVSVGRCFGMLIAERLRVLREGEKGGFWICEAGAHDGSLCRDILRVAAEFGADWRYLIVEPLAERRAALEKGVGAEFPTLEVRAEWPEEPREGVLIANELLDALSVPLFNFDGETWRELGVEWDGERFVFAERPEVAEKNRAFVAGLGGNFPAGYVCEGPPDFRGVLEPAARTLRGGRMIFFDYGFDRETLLHPGRTGGTLRAYGKQRTKLHPLDDPGGQDLTAHVNFSSLEETLNELGFETQPPMAQGRWLTYAARRWLEKGPHEPELIRQFRTLVHPSQFGSAFYVVEAGSRSRRMP